MVGRRRRRAATVWRPAAGGGRGGTGVVGRRRRPAGEAAGVRPTSRPSRRDNRFWARLFFLGVFSARFLQNWSREPLSAPRRP